MPTKRDRDPGAELEAILWDAARRILALVRRDQDALHSALEARLGPRPGPLPQGPAAPARRRPHSKRAPERGQRVPTEDVATELRRLFGAEDRGLRLAELRAATGFGNMQLHRALQLLLESGEISKRGKLRKTEYLRSRTRSGSGKRSGRRGRDKRDR